MPALAAWLSRPNAFIVGVEAIFEALVEDSIALEEGLEHEGLEEPGGVSEVPLGWACVVIGLDDLVLVAQGPRQLGGEATRGS